MARWSVTVVGCPRPLLPPTGRRTDLRDVAEVLARRTQGETAGGGSWRIRATSQADPYGDRADQIAFAIGRARRARTRGHERVLPEGRLDEHAPSNTRWRRKEPDRELRLPQRTLSAAEPDVRQAERGLNIHEALALQRIGPFQRSPLPGPLGPRPGSGSPACGTARSCRASAVKDWMHLCLQPRQRREVEVEPSRPGGAYVRRPAQAPTAPAGPCLADPEGNEFCALRSAAERASTG